MTAISGENARGAAISIVGQAFRFLVRFIGLAIISRLLQPEEVGLAAIALSLVGLAGILGDFGLSLAAIAAGRLTERQSSNLFWLNLLIGAVLSAIIIALAPVSASLFSFELLAPLLILMAPVFLLNGASIQHRVILTRRRRFKALALTEAVAPLGGVLVGIVLAIEGAGAFSIVGQEIVTAVSLLIGYMWSSKWLPSKPYSFSNLRTFFGFSLATTITQVVNYLSTYSPQWFTGAFLGAASAGQFTRAFQILMLPIQQLAGPLTRVTLPLLSAASEENFSEGFHKVQTLLTYVLCFPLLVITVIADPLVRFALGEGWEEAANILSVLCIGGCFQSAGYAYYWGFLARKQTKSLLFAELIGRVPMVIFVYIGATISVTWTAVAFSAGLCLIWITTTVEAHKRLPISAERSRGTFIRGLGAGLVACSIALYIEYVFFENSISSSSPFVALSVFIALLSMMLITAGFRKDVQLVWSVVSKLRR